VRLHSDREERNRKKEKENLRGDEGYSQNIEQKGKKRFTK